MNTYIFELTWFNDVDNAEVKIGGIVPGNSYEDAMQRLSDYYGESEICNVNLECISDHAVVELPDYVNLEDIKRMNEF